MTTMEVKIVNKGPHALPQYGTPQSAGMDLRAWLDTALTLQPLERALITPASTCSCHRDMSAKCAPAADWH